MQITHLPESKSQPPCPPVPRSLRRRMSELNGCSRSESRLGANLGFCDTTAGSLSALAWHFERHHHEPIRVRFSALLRQLEREYEARDLDGIAMLRNLRAALEHHFYRSERLLFPQIRRLNGGGACDADGIDLLGPVERSNRDLRRLLTRVWDEPGSGSGKQGWERIRPESEPLFEAIGAFLVLESEILLPRCRTMFRGTP